METVMQLSSNEVLSLILSALVFVYMLFHARTLLKQRYAPIAFGFLCVLGSFLATNVEEFILEELFNVVEHASMAAGAILVTLGCRRALGGGSEEESP